MKESGSCRNLAQLDYNLSLLSTGVSAGGWAFAAFSPNITAEWAGRFRDYSTADGC